MISIFYIVIIMIIGLVSVAMIMMLEWFAVSDDL